MSDLEAYMVQEHERKIIRLEAKVEMLEVDQQRLKDELAVYQASTVNANKKLDALMVAIVGDDAMHTKGLIHRFESVEAITDMVKEWKWKAAGGAIVLGWAISFGYWALQHFFK